MIRTSLVVLLTLLIPLSLQAQDVGEDEESKNPAVLELRLDEVPVAALEAARKEKPEVYFKSAERMIWNDEPIYRIMGAQYRTEWSVYVNAQGQVWEVDSNAMDRDSR